MTSAAMSRYPAVTHWTVLRLTWNCRSSAGKVTFIEVSVSTPMKDMSATIVTTNMGRSLGVELGVAVDNFE